MFLAAAAAFLVVSSPPADAQPRAVFLPPPAALLPLPPAEPAAPPGVLRSRLAVLDLDALAASQPGAGPAFVFNAFDDAAVPVRLADVGEPSLSPGYVFTGSTADGSGSLTLVVHLAAGGEVAAVSGSLSSAEGSFSVSMPIPGLVRIDELDLSVPRRDEVLDVPGRLLPGRRPGPVAADPGPSVSASSPVDVLVVFTPAVEGELGGRPAVLAVVDRLVAEMNGALARAPLPRRVSLLAARRVAFFETPDGMGVDLDALASPSDGVMDLVHEWRSQVGADLVHLLASYPIAPGSDSALCGAAYTALSPFWGFAATNSEKVCLDGTTFAHELGHNFGLRHDRRTELDNGGLPGRPAWLPYAYGFTNAGGVRPENEVLCYATIMAYAGPCFAALGADRGLLRARYRPVPRFSDPDASVGGVALGVKGAVETHGADGPADAVRALGMSWSTVAAYRPRGGVPGNRGPRIVRRLPDVAVEPDGVLEIELDGVFADPDGDDLIWEAWSSDTWVVTTTGTGTVLELHAGSRRGSAVVTVAASDPGGMTISQAFRVSVGRSNVAPRPVQLPDRRLEPGGSATIDLDSAFSDPDGDDLIYGARSTDDLVVSTWLDANILTLAAGRPGRARVTLTARDPGGLRAFQAIRVTVRERGNRAPEVLADLPGVVLGVADPALRVEAARAFEDPDGDDLRFEVSSSAPRVASAAVDPAAGVLTVSPRRAGSARIAVTATDPDGLSASTSFPVRVAAPFTDPVLVPGETLVKAVHWTELRTRVDQLLEEAGLDPWPWTPPVLRPGSTVVRLAHLLDLRRALDAAHAARGVEPPDYTDPAPVRGETPVRAAHIMELRRAVRALEVPGGRR